MKLFKTFILLSVFVLFTVVFSLARAATSPANYGTVFATSTIDGKAYAYDYLISNTGTWVKSGVVQNMVNALLGANSNTSATGLNITKPAPNGWAVYHQAFAGLNATLPVNLMSVWPMANTAGVYVKSLSYTYNNQPEGKSYLFPMQCSPKSNLTAGNLHLVGIVTGVNPAITPWKVCRFVLPNNAVAADQVKAFMQLYGTISYSQAQFTNTPINTIFNNLPYTPVGVSTVVGNVFGSCQ